MNNLIYNRQTSKVVGCQANAYRNYCDECVSSDDCTDRYMTKEHTSKAVHCEL